MGTSTKGIVFFDLDDTLIHSATLDREKIVPSFPGFVTALSFQNPAQSMLTFVRPFALSLLHAVHRLGFQVAFWSAGDPSYVHAVVETLVETARANDLILRPSMVIALDQSASVWVRVRGRRRGGRGRDGDGAASSSTPRVTRLMPAQPHSTYGVIKDMAALHARLRLDVPLDNCLLVDNLPHKAPHTLRVPPFGPDTGIVDTALYRLALWFEKHAATGKTFAQRRPPKLAKAKWEADRFYAPDLKREGADPAQTEWKKGDVGFVRDKSRVVPVRSVRVRKSAKVVNESTRKVSRKTVDVNGGKVFVKRLRATLL